MTSRVCPYCGKETLIRIGSNTIHGKQPEDPYWIHIVNWADKDCGYRETTTPDEVYDYTLNQIRECERKVISFHIPTPPLPLEQQPEHIRKAREQLERYAKRKPELILNERDATGTAPPSGVTERRAVQDDSPD